MTKYAKSVFCILILMSTFKGHCFHLLLFTVTATWNKNLIAESPRHEVMGNSERIDFLFDKNKLPLISVDQCIDHWPLYEFIQTHVYRHCLVTICNFKQSLKDTTCNQTKLTHNTNGKDLLLVTLPSPSKNHLEKIRAVIINLSVIR